MASFPVGSVLSKLGQLATSEANFLLGLDGDIKLIKVKLEWLNKFLADADQKQRHKKHELLRVWVKQLREVAYDLEDVVDEYSVKVDLQRMGFSGWRASPWLHFLTSPNHQLFTRHYLASQCREIKATLEEIASNKAMFLDSIDLSLSPQDFSRDMGINILRTEVEEEPTGQNTYIENLIPQILGSNAQRLAIIPIFGMGGLGKTTLAKKLYNDAEVTSHFDLRAWLTISQTFSIVDLLRRLIDQLNVKDEEMMKWKEEKEEEMKRKLKEHLSKKSFIIVLDDVWDISSWDYLKTLFPNDHKGITVLLTTRNKNVATHVNPDGEPLELQSLQPEEAWQLFCRKAFTDAKCPENFHVFKSDVIERSKGLPLAIVVLGGLLRKTKDPDQWKKILSHSRREDDETLNILSLSYDYLPHYLKACFLYVAGYPEDCEIDATTLKWRWIAEGFIKQQREQTMEDSSEIYLEELIQRSLIQLVKRGYVGQIKTVRVHDLVLDMACKEAREIDFLDQNVPQQSSILARRLSIYGDDVDDIQKQLYCLCNYAAVPKLRSLLMQCTRSRIELHSTYFKFQSTKFVRVLMLKGIIFRKGKCPEAIGNMIQLRYLCFADAYLSKLPSNLSNLENLQTLDVSDARGTKRVPKKFWEISSLRHVIGDSFFKINPGGKQDVGKMKELQTLGGRVSYKWIIGGGFRQLTNIRTLRLTGVFKHWCQKIDVGKVEEKVIDGIENMKHLTFLNLGDELASKQVLTANNTSLQCLVLSGGEPNSRLSSNGSHQPLQNLRKLLLWKMKVTEDEMDVVGSLPKLQTLHISWDDQLKKLVFKQGCFSCLQELKLDGCEKLERWEIEGDWSNSTTMLQLVQIEVCPELKLLPNELKVKEIRHGPFTRHYDGKVRLREEVRLWAKLMSESPTKTNVIQL